MWFPGLNAQFINYQINEDDNDYLRSGKAKSNDSAVGRVEIIGSVLEDTSRCSWRRAHLDHLVAWFEFSVLNSVGRS